MTVIESQRHRFDIPREIHYLNCGYMSPLARQVLVAMHDGAKLKSRPWAYTAPDFFTYPEALRGRFASVLGCAADDVAIVPSASYGLAIAARNISLAAGQDIVLLAEQFPSNVYAWRARAQAAGARVLTVERDADRDWTPAVLDAIGSDTGVVAVPNCHWADGAVIDLVAVGAACRRQGAALVLDLTQSLGAMPFDIEKVQPDFVVAAAYKWLFGPYGSGLLYAAPKHHGGEPIEYTWLNRARAEDFARLVDYRDDYQTGARRFDMGEKSNPPLLMGAAAGIDLVLEWGIERIAATLAAKTDVIAVEARRIGLRVLERPLRAPHFVGLGFPAGTPAGLVERLAQASVFASLRGDSLRVTPHLYNDEHDIDALLSVLRSVV